jgi:hypothetical protein
LNFVFQERIGYGPRRTGAPDDFIAGLLDFIHGWLTAQPRAKRRYRFGPRFSRLAVSDDRLSELHLRCTDHERETNAVIETVR